MEVREAGLIAGDGIYGFFPAIAKHSLVNLGLPVALRPGNFGISILLLGWWKDERLELAFRVLTTND